MRYLPLLTALLASCAPPEGDTADGDEIAAMEKLPAGLQERVAAGEPVTVLVKLAERDLEPAFAGLEGAARRDARAAALGERMDGVLADMPRGGFDILARYKHVPMIPMTLRDAAAVEALVRDGRVEQVFLELQHEPHLTQSLDHIDQPEAETLGYTGAGTTVAVLDTGLDYTRAAFGSCVAPNASGCSVVVAMDFAPEDNSKDTGSYHGTNVAGIVAGVAPGADLAGLDVFGSGGTASSTDIVEAIDWVVDNHGTYNFASINMSLGSGGYSSECSGIYSSAFQAARDAGILPVVSSGNDGYTGKISSPACDPDALSVGAVYDSNIGGISWSGCSDNNTYADKVTCFSNSASFLDILAPGALITAADITMGGTSQAAPHVAGAVAVVAEAFPDYTADQLQDRLVSTGVDVTDTRQSRVLPRLDLDAAVQGGGEGGGDEEEEDPLAGTVTINSGAEWTSSTASTLTLAATAGTPTQMCISNSSTCSSWATYSANKSWTLKSGAGTKTVSVWFKDAEGNISAVATDTIGLDTTAPANGTVSGEGSTGMLALTWTGFSDSTGSGVSSYKVVYKSGTTLPSSKCANGTVAYTGSGSGAEISGLTNGTTYSVRVCAIDAAGNTSTGATAALIPAPEYVGPTGTVSINSGAAWTGSTASTLTLSASDESGVSKVCISNSSTCSSSSWATYAASKSWTLKSGTGTKTVYVWFQDIYGNVSSVVTDTIGLDSTKPSSPTLSGMAKGDINYLYWSAATDANSGLAGYKVVYKTGSTAPSSCSSGTVLYQGTNTYAAHENLTSGTSYSYRMCAVDAVGNVSSGSTRTVVAQ